MGDTCLLCHLSVLYLSLSLSLSLWSHPGSRPSSHQLGIGTRGSALQDLQLADLRLHREEHGSGEVSHCLADAARDQSLREERVRDERGEGGHEKGQEEGTRKRELEEEGDRTERAKWWHDKTERRRRRKLPQ